MRYIKEFASIYNTEEGMIALLFTAGTTALVSSTVLLANLVGGIYG